MVSLVITRNFSKAPFVRFDRILSASPSVTQILSKYSHFQMDCRCRESMHTNGNKEVNRFHAVLAFGDSNTWGFDPSSPGNGAATLRHPYRSRWTTQANEALGQNVHIIPEGLNARTTIIRDPMSPCDGKITIYQHAISHR